MISYRFFTISMRVIVALAFYLSCALAVRALSDSSCTWVDPKTGATYDLSGLRNETGDYVLQPSVRLYAFARTSFTAFPYFLARTDA